MKHPDDEQVREAFDVGEPFLKLREDFQDAFGVVFRAAAPGDLTGLRIRASNKSNWLHIYHLNESTESLESLESLLNR